jgi:hypothetical protein
MAFRSARAAVAGKDGRRVHWMTQTTRATNKSNRTIGVTRIGSNQPYPPEGVTSPAMGSLRITVNLAAENRDIADNPYPSIQPRVTTENAQGDKVSLPSADEVSTAWSTV